MGYRDTIDYIFGLQKHGIKFGLANSRLLMDLLGNPQRVFNAVHVAGTNGKGSTSFFIASILQAAGYRVGLYTSPHLVSFTERVRINGVPIPEEDVVRIAEQVRQRSRDVPGEGGTVMSPTFFEVTTAVAFTYFAEQHIDIAVVEAGMGGRLDSTNVIAPLVSVITNIDLEHQEYLGSTLSAIAMEKAGIIKRGAPVVTGAVQSEVIRVLESRASDERTPLYLLSRDFRAERPIRGRKQVFDYRGIHISLPDLRLAMLGRHQTDNACLALAAAECLLGTGMSVDEAAMRMGTEQAIWEGRLERVADRPDIYLDGAHNPAAARALAVELRELRGSYRKLILVIGILADKDYGGILSELLPLADHVVVTRASYTRALDAARIAELIAGNNASVSITEAVGHALAQARRIAGEDGLIIVTGSLYVVGDARAALRGEAEVPSGLSGLKG